MGLDDKPVAEDNSTGDYQPIGKTGMVAYEPNKKVTENKTTTSTTATATTAAKTTCEHECCAENDTRRLPKPCLGGLICENHTCIDPPCPFECCILGRYMDKKCPDPMECVNSICVKAKCPLGYDCCNSTYYDPPKDCSAGFVCLNGKCVAVDSDGDGLADGVEGNYGADSARWDTDGDGLGDGYEVYTMKTLPNSSNTDKDRYPDAKDANPTYTDTAKVNITVVTEVYVNESVIKALLMHLDFGQSPPDPDAAVAEFISQIRLHNYGTDYTEYVNYTYHIGYWCAPGIDVRRKPFIYRYLPPGNTSVNQSWVGYRGEWNDTENAMEWTVKEIQLSTNRRMNPHERYITRFTYTLRFKETANSTWAAIVSNRRCGYNVTIRDVIYESYGGLQQALNINA